MRAYIKLWGNEYLLDSVSWYQEGRISHVSFTDENDDLYVIFDKNFSSDLDAETNRNPNENLHSDFNKTLFWKQK
ncbi:hypothetical protein [Oceanobacillus caeni]|uniref:Uncharacterized protein n=1 Tax=Oceanobacillus caeni TaxID=405946 RepID=A0ABR5MK61_9BACI|nr:hypothetical protein [Oceanobacillus caeni]KPH76092.1 hypothetical protein AFL42_07295 [Oceanobacillus caeni]